MRPLQPDVDLDLGLGLDHATRSDGAGSFSSNPIHFDSTASHANHVNMYECTEPTKATPVDEGDYDANGVPLPVHSPCCSKHGQARDNVLSEAEMCIGQPTVAHDSCVNDNGFSDHGNLVSDASTVTQTGTAEDPLASNFGPGRYKGGASYLALGPRSEEAAEAQLAEGSSLLNAAWKHPDESAYEAGKVIQGGEKLAVLQDSVTSSHAPGVNYHSAHGLFTPILDSLMPATHLCATQDEPSPCVSCTARETQVHELDNAIHRLMPSNRIIYFGVDRDSFKRGCVPDEVTDRVISAAQEIVSHIEREELGIKFSYCPNSAFNAFNICYDQSLKRQTLARAFFPSDPRTHWKLRISKTLVFSKSELDYLPNILAHEFMHILGLRHWNADTCEAEERSFQWPNTKWQSRDSVMITGVHPSKMWFFTEDFRVVREIYSHENGDVVAGRYIVDVHP